jgi:hypothetical protein
MDRLWRSNLIAAGLHFFNGGAGLLLLLTVTNISDFKISLTTMFLNWESDPYQDVVVQWDFPFALFTTFFAFMSALAHLLVIMHFGTYEAGLKKGINRFRWYEYAFSSSLMIVLICMLWGVWDIFSLILIACINASMNLFGDCMELLNAGKPAEEVDWTPFWYGCVAGGYAWIVVLTYTFSGQVSEVPTFVWGILVSYIIFFNTFPVTMYRQYKQLGDFNNANYPLLKNGGYLHGERSYIKLSFLAKSFLLWLVFTGTMQPSEYTNTA